jgi:PAS domain S-box-containing protein
MPPIYSLYVGLLISALLVSVLLFFLTLKHRASGVVQAYLIFVFLSCGIETASLLSLYSPDAAWATWWHGNLRFAILGLIMPLTFLFVSLLLEPSKGLLGNYPWWLFPIPVLMIFFSLTNDWHHWVFRDYRMVNEFGLFLRAGWNPGPWFYVHLVNSNAIGLLIIRLLVNRFHQPYGVPRLRGILAIWIVILTFAATGLDVFGLALAPGLLWAPIGFGLINVLIMVGVIYLDLFDVLPMARERLFHYMADIVLILDADDRIVEINPAGERSFQVNLKSIRGRPFNDLIDIDHIEAAQIISSQSQYRGEISLVIDQKPHWFDVNLSTVYLEEGVPGAKLIVMRDITEQKELQQREQELAAFEERQRLARDLHDAVSQTLFSARLTSEAMLRQKDELAPAVLWENLRQVTRLIVSALGEMRILLLELRPEGLTSAPLPVLLAHLADATGARTTASLHFTAQGEADLPQDVKIAFYRIAQEALNNSVKYAHASQINLTLIQAGRRVKLSVSDDGQGFEIPHREDGHFGLSIMRERAAEIGALLEITSQPGASTSLNCDWQG